MKTIFVLSFLIALTSCKGKVQNNDNDKTYLLDSLFENYEFNELRILTDSLLKKNSKDPAALAHHGYLAYYLQEIDSSLKDLNTAFELGYDSPALRTIRGTIYMMKADYKNALIDFNNHSKMGYSEFMVSRNRAVIYDDLNQCRKAIPDYRFLMTLSDSLYMRYSTIIGDCFEHYKMFDSSIVYYTYAIEKKPNPNDLNRRGISYSSIDKYENAISDYNTGLLMTERTDSLNRMVLLTNKSSAQRSLGLLDSALININNAINLTNFPEETLLPNKSRLLLDMGKAKEAIKILEALPPKYLNENLHLLEECKKEL